MKSIIVIGNPAKTTQTREAAGIMRVAVYCRVSTLFEEQAESYETQCEYYTQLVAADPTLVLAGVYGDHGISGLNADKRPEFMRMMQDCMDGKADIVLTKSVSRFARNLADCAYYVRKLKDKGIPVLFEKEGVNTMDEGGEFLLSVMAAMAQEEASNLSRNIRWSLEHRNACGCASRVARYGYRKAQNTWKAYEPEAKRVRLAFLLAARERDYQAIISALNDMEQNEGSGVNWTQPRIYEMLRSEVYIGNILTNKGFRPDYLSKRVVKNNGQRTQYYLERHHEPIIDRNTFERVNKLIRRNALRTKRRSMSK